MNTDTKHIIDIYSEVCNFKNICLMPFIVLIGLLIFGFILHCMFFLVQIPIF